METNQQWVDYEISNNSIWHIPSRYSNLVPLGAGGFGFVCSADDSVSNEKVAIKKLFTPFATNIDAKRAFREIKLLKHVAHDNIIELLDVFCEASHPTELNHIYLVTELMSTDLYKVISSQELTDDQIRFLIYQLLRGLKFLHTSSPPIIHRDLKPGNLAVNENADLKLIDFGLARGETGQAYTGYVQARWYRAPEVILSWMHYSRAVDIWSVGCILAEMYLRRPVFAGQQTADQLKRIMDVVGFPSEALLQRLEPEIQNYMLNLQYRPVRVNFSDFFLGISNSAAVDLLEKMLVLDPNERITCEQALAHPFLESFHDSKDEPNGIGYDDTFESQEFTVEEWKCRLLFIT